jgi:hypothetical protein
LSPDSATARSARAAGLGLHRSVCAALVLAAGASTGAAEDVEFFRLSAPSETAIVGFAGDGFMVWTNASPESDATLERMCGAGAAWQEYVRIPVTGAQQTLRVFDPSPPPGMTLIPGGSS